MTDTRIAQIVKELKDSDNAVRSEAERKFRKIAKSQITVEEGIEALYSAAGDFPLKGDAWDDPSADLVLALADTNPYREYMPVVKEIFPQLSQEAKGWALRLLTALNSRDAASLLLELLDSYSWTRRSNYVVFLHLHRKPHHGDIYFPKLLEHARKPEMASEVYSLALEYLTANKISPEILVPYADQTLAAYAPLRDQLSPLQKSEGIAWMWREEYRELRGNAGILLDLIGYLPVERVHAQLYHAFGFNDPKLKFFGAVSLLRLGHPVPSVVFTQIAASAEARKWLFIELEKREKLYLMPDEYQTQAALAESDLVSWLTFGTELGCAPDEIELMQVFSVPVQEFEETLEYYLFRFRTFSPHWAAKDGWMAGLSGPFIQGEPPRAHSYGETFSTFDGWDSKTPEEHLGNIQDLMENWRRSRESHWNQSPDSDIQDAESSDD